MPECDLPMKRTLSAVHIDKSVLACRSIASANTFLRSAQRDRKGGCGTWLSKHCLGIIDLKFGFMKRLRSEQERKDLCYITPDLRSQSPSHTHKRPPPPVASGFAASPSSADVDFVGAEAGKPCSWSQRDRSCSASGKAGAASTCACVIRRSYIIFMFIGYPSVINPKGTKLFLLFILFSCMPRSCNASDTAWAASTCACVIPIQGLRFTVYGLGFRV